MAANCLVKITLWFVAWMGESWGGRGDLGESFNEENSQLSGGKNLIIEIKNIPNLITVHKQKAGMHSTASLSHLRTMLPESSSRPLPVKWPNHTT